METLHATLEVNGFEVGSVCLARASTFFSRRKLNAAINMVNAVQHNQVVLSVSGVMEEMGLRKAL